VCPVSCVLSTPGWGQWEQKGDTGVLVSLYLFLLLAFHLCVCEVTLRVSSHICLLPSHSTKETPMRPSSGSHPAGMGGWASLKQNDIYLTYIKVDSPLTEVKWKAKCDSAGLHKKSLCYYSLTCSQRV
jgi:hypothetical protein